MRTLEARVLLDRPLDLDRDPPLHRQRESLSLSLRTLSAPSFLRRKGKPTAGVLLKSSGPREGQTDTRTSRVVCETILSVPRAGRKVIDTGTTKLSESRHRRLVRQTKSAERERQTLAS